MKGLISKLDTYDTTQWATNVSVESSDHTLRELLTIISESRACFKSCHIQGLIHKFSFGCWLWYNSWLSVSKSSICDYHHKSWHQVCGVVFCRIRCNYGDIKDAVEAKRRGWTCSKQCNGCYTREHGLPSFREVLSCNMKWPALTNPKTPPVSHWRGLLFYWKQAVCSNKIGHS